MSTLTRPCVAALIGLTLAAVAAPARSLAAQSLELGLWGGGARSNEVTTGISLCNANGCGPSSSWPHYERNAVTGGIGARLQLHDRVAVQAGLSLGRKGFGPGPSPADRRVDSRYLELDLTGQVRVVSYGPAALWLGGGLAPSLLLRCQTSGTTVSGFEATACGVSSAASGVRHGPEVDHDLGWVAGPLIRVASPVGVFRLQARYMRGMLDIRPDEEGTTTNRSFLVAAGFSKAVGRLSR